MSNKDNFFFFGFGQTAKYFVNNLDQSKKKFTLSATNTKKTSLKTFCKKKFKSFKFKDKVYDKKLIKKLSQADYILVSIPPQNKKDLVLKNFREILKKSKFKKLIYLSATSVYGNHNGKWVNENSKLKGSTRFGLRRKIVEKTWVKFRDSNNLDINILRVSGIYSKENNVLKKINRTNIYVKEKKYFSRIRIEDLAQIIKKMFYSKKNFLILNASDDKPATNIEVANFAAKLLKIKNLKPLSIKKFKNKMIKEFYKDSKKVSNKKMKNNLQIKLKYPTYKEGLRNIFNNTR
ncbi:NAD-dependent epimerase/dehydratase family protein [Pelagibacteraceae bacterium]|nr:NAD-dependent epimerase/dehydratase family protein [Pelagibacteraceae bacterium]